MLTQSPPLIQDEARAGRLSWEMVTAWPKDGTEEEGKKKLELKKLKPLEAPALLEGFVPPVRTLGRS